MEENKHHGKSNTFLWGVVIGGVLVYLLTSKKGRKILKELSTVGLDALENLGNLEELEDEIEEELPKEEIFTEPKSNGNNPVVTKRFFRGIKKK